MHRLRAGALDLSLTSLGKSFPLHLCFLIWEMDLLVAPLKGARPLKRPLFKFAIAVFPQKSVQCVFHMCGDKTMAFAPSLVPSSDSCGRMDRAHPTSQRRGRWGCVLLPSLPHHLAPLSIQRAGLVISPLADPRTVIVLFHPQPNSTPFTFLPLN